MAYAIAQFDATDEAGNLLTDVTVEVRRESGGLQSVFADREGTMPLGSRFAVASGRVEFFAPGNAYRIRLTKADYVRDLRFFAIGLASESDMVIRNFRGEWAADETYRTFEMVTHSGLGFFVSNIEENLANEPDAATPGSTAEWTFWQQEAPTGWKSVALMTVTGGTADAVTATVEAGIDPASVVMYVINPVSANTGPVTINGVELLAFDGSPLGAGYLQPGAPVLFEPVESAYRLVMDHRFQILADAAQQSADDAAESYNDLTSLWLGRFVNDAAASAAAGVAVGGQIYWNTTASGFRYWNGAAWADIPYATVADGFVTAAKISDDTGERDAIRRKIGAAGSDLDFTVRKTRAGNGGRHQYRVVSRPEPATGSRTVSMHLTHVDVAGATNLNTSVPGLLKPTGTTDTYVSIFDPTLTTNAEAQPSVRRQVIAASLLTKLGSGKVKVTFAAVSAGSAMVVTDVFCGLKGAVAPNFDGNQVRVKFNGLNGFSIAAGTSITSDPIDLAVDGNTDLVVAFSPVTGSASRYASGVTGCSDFYKAGGAASEAGDTTVSGFTLVASQIVAIDMISASAGAARVPAMTANNAPAPYVVSSTGSYLTQLPWLAFDRNAGTYWQNAEAPNPEYLKVDLGAANAAPVSVYSLTASPTAFANMIRDWKLQGSDDNAAWVDLDTRSGIAFTASQTRYFNLAAVSAPYRYYRILFTANSAGTLNHVVHEMQMYGPSQTLNMTVRSVAFVAAAAPTKLKGLIRVREVDAALPNTDFTFDGSRGSDNWTSMPLVKLFSLAGRTYYETAEVDVSGQASGVAPRYRFKNLNNKNVELHDAYFYWSE